MGIITLLTGLGLIGLGFLIKSSPNLIAGYNTLSKERKRLVDIDGLSSFMRNGLIIIGSTMIIGYYLFKQVELTALANLTIILVTLPGVIALVIGAQRFNHKNPAGKNDNLGETSDTITETKLKYSIPGFMVLVFVVVIGFMIYSLIPSKVIFNDTNIQITGIYGFDLNNADLEKIELTDKIPTIKRRTNGFNLGSVNKGEFDLFEFGNTRLFLHADKPPYLIITQRNSEKTIINYEDKVETEAIYARLKLLVDDH